MRLPFEFNIARLKPDRLARSLKLKQNLSALRLRSQTPVDTSGKPEDKKLEIISVLNDNLSRNRDVPATDRALNWQEMNYNPITLPEALEIIGTALAPRFAARRGYHELIAIAADPQRWN